MNETQSLLTDAERAEGWIECDGKGFPEALKRHKGVIDELYGDRSTILGLPVSATLMYESNYLEWIDGGKGSTDCIAWRPYGQTAKAEAPREARIAPERDGVFEGYGECDPNTDMLARDQPRPVAVPVSTPAPRVERSPLLTIAPISTTGFSYWGEQS